MVQMQFPAAFDEGELDDRLVRLSKWAARAHPGKRFTLKELSELTGIPVSTIDHLQSRALDKIAPKLYELKNEYTNNIADEDR